MTHELKIWPEYFESVRDGLKPFELRRHDRPFGEGDILHLREWDNHEERYTGRDTCKLVTYVLCDAIQFGLRGDYCILGLAPFNPEQIAT